MKNTNLTSVAHVKHPLISEIEAGLLDISPYISPKFLYDPLGSHLFTAITLLPEYYPTITEKSIFVEFKNEINEAAKFNKFDPYFKYNLQLFYFCSKH